MVDSLAITSAAPPAPGPQTTRVTASAGDDGSSNFAQALHAANDASSTASNAQPTATVKAPSIPSSAVPATQAAVGQASTAQADASTPNIPSTPNLPSVPTASSSLEAVSTEDEVVPVTDSATPADSESVKATPADATAPAAGRTDVPSQVSSPVTAQADSKVTTPAAIDHPAKGEPAKHHGKKHSVAAVEDANPAVPAQTSLAANSVAAAVSPSPVPTATPTSGRAASPQETTPVRVGGPLTQAAPASSSATLVVPPTPSAQAGPPPQVLQATDRAPATNTAQAVQQNTQPEPPVTTGSAVPQPLLTNATVPAKTSQTTRTVKAAASPAGDTAPDDTLASAGTGVAGKSADFVPASATQAPSFAAALPRHVAAEIAVPSVPQPLTTHTTFHPSQDSAAIGTGLQASGAVLQPAPEMATRSPALEVGFHDANLGWLSVRASTDVSGGLHAAVGAKTPAALAAVDTMLPALDRFLQQENVAVHSVSAASAAAGGTFAPSLASASSYGHAGSGHTGSSAQQQGTGRDTSQRNPERNPGTASAQTERAASRLTSVSTVLRYSQGEQSSTLSVRI